MDEKFDKLLDWAVVALSKGDNDAAASLYKLYADRVRSFNPELALFYERLLEPSCDPDDISLLSSELATLSDRGQPTANAIDRLLAASLSLLKNDKKDEFRTVIVDVLFYYCDALRGTLENLRSRSALPYDVAELRDMLDRITFGVNRLQDTYEK